MGIVTIETEKFGNVEEIETEFLICTESKIAVSPAEDKIKKPFFLVWTTTYSVHFLLMTQNRIS